MSEQAPTRPELPGSPFLWRAVALGAAAGGVYMMVTQRGPIAVAILLLIVALAAAGVLLGAGGHSSSEGVLDLSARLGLGLLGGLLGGIVSLAMREAVVGLGVSSALGVALPAGFEAMQLLGHLGSGAVWGMVLGILYPHFPGTSPASRGVLFSLIPSLYLLLKVYPVDRDIGLLGIDRGTLTFAFVLGLNILWGAVAAMTIGWGEVAEEAPVARPIDA